MARGRGDGAPDPPGVLHLPERAPAARARAGARSRAMRSGMRGLVRRFTEIGIPASRVALELQFHSAPGQGGREGLQPRSKWLEIVKLEALAARQVTKELGTHSIWSWGWATFSTAGIDRDKGEAVCVYLWVRDPKPLQRPGSGEARRSTPRSRPASSRFPPARSARCRRASSGRRRSLRSCARSATATSPGASSSSGSCSQSKVELEPGDVLAAEARLVEERYGGSLVGYRTALARARLGRTAARALLADEIRREAIRSRFRPSPPSAGAVAAFHATYARCRPGTSRRHARSAWLGGRHRGARARDGRAAPDLLPGEQRLRPQPAGAGRGAPARGRRRCSARSRSPRRAPRSSSH